MIRRAVLSAIAVAVTACGNEIQTVPVADAGMLLPRAVCLDNDGDGYAGTGDCAAERQVDCNDTDPLTYPGAPEQCNGVDDNCNAALDEGLPVVGYYRDEDGDGLGATKVGEGCEAAPAGSVTQPGDCDDRSTAIRPGQAEICNGVDDDCDGTPDDGLPFQDFYLDQDGDGFGSSVSAPLSSCQTTVAGRVTNPGDCHDGDPTIKPGGLELCNKVDDNCDGQLDNGIASKSYYADTDGDGFGDARAQPESSCAPVPGKVENNTDCNDAIATVKPGAPEVCNGADDDCDQQRDEGLTFTNYFPDQDGDGFGAAGAGAQSSCIPVPGKVSNANDCNDLSPAVKPTATETCNAVDDDCSGSVDEGLAFVDYFPDQDGDGFGASTGAQSACSPLAGRVTNSQDCNDSNPAVKPTAPETCNGVDDDCSGATDEGLTFVDYYPDGDGDGHGAASATAQRSCLPISGRVTNRTDCNDANAAINPGRTETCNGVDDNCSGAADEGLATQSYFPDGDGDGFGRAGAAAVVSCGPVANHVLSSTDCNDASASVRPGATELCNDVDDDCDGAVDDGVATQSYYVDVDGDGFGASGSVPQADCAAVAGRVTNATDCNDLNAAIKPTATEVCNDVDDDCDLQTDEGLTRLSYYPDVDGDGYGAAGASVQLSCRAVTGKVTNSSDCHDGNSAIKPTAAETCNGVDDNCAGGIDEGNPGGGAACSTGQSGVCGPGTLRCVSASVACVRNVAPGTESCNSLDDDCDGVTDDGFVGLGEACTAGLGSCARNGTNVCNAGGTGVVCSVSAGSPTAPACDGEDNDCDGVVDEPLLTNTGTVATTPFPDIEVRPFYYSAASCQGGQADAGTDALVGGALVMAGGTSGVRFQSLTAAGELTDAGSLVVTPLNYTDVDFAQAGDGFLIAGIWANNNSEIDLYFVDRNGNQRVHEYTEFVPATGQTIDSLRVVRGNGKRVTLVWRETDAGVKMAQVEPCDTSGSWSIRPAGCGTGTLSSTTVVASTTVPAGLGADSAHADWAATQACGGAAQRRLAVSYLASPTSLRMFRVDENGANKEADTLVSVASAPRALAEPEVTYFRDPADQFLVSYVTKDPGATTPQADLNYWLTNDPGWNYFTWFDYATQNGADSIARPRASATANRLWLSATRSVADASTFKRQVMTRTLDLFGNRTPIGSAVEFSVTTGTCTTDPACRPGDKSGFTHWAPFGKVFYAGSGSTPSGTFGSTLTCN